MLFGGSGLIVVPRIIAARTTYRPGSGRNKSTKLNLSQNVAMLAQTQGI